MESESSMTHANQFIEGIGRRKSATCRVRISTQTDENAQSEVDINGTPLENYFEVASLQNTVFAPLRLTGGNVSFYVTVRVRGGGIAGQADAIQLGLARALEKWDSDLRRSLKDNGYLSRDPRVKERKKPGLRKARKHPEWSKR